MSVAHAVSRPPRRKRSASGASGQSVVELAVILPVIMLILMGAVDFGRLMQARVVSEAAVRTGASWGAGILANATLPLSPVFKLSTSDCTYGPTCNIESRACAEAAGFPNYSAGELLTANGGDKYTDCANNHPSSSNSKANVCSPSATQSNPFFEVQWKRANGTAFVPSSTVQAQIGDTIEVSGTYCFRALFPWPGIPNPTTWTSTSKFTIQP